MSSSLKKKYFFLVLPIKKFFFLEYESVLKKNFNVYVSSFGDNFLVSFVDTTQVYKLEKLKTDFIGNISHALKTPLAIILGIVETFIHQKRLSVKEKEGFLKTLNLETISMKNIVENPSKTFRKLYSRLV